MVLGLVYIAYILALVGNSVQFNGRFYSNVKTPHKSLLAVVQNFDIAGENTMVFVFGLSNDDIRKNKQYALQSAAEMDDNCQALENFILNLGNSNPSLHVVNDMDDVTERGIFVLDKLPSEAEVAELVNTAQSVSIALTTCQLVHIQPPPKQAINEVNRPVGVKKAKKKGKDEIVGNDKDDDIRVSSMQIEQITVILSIMFVVVGGSLFMVNISTPNSVKQNIKIGIK